MNRQLDAAVALAHLSRCNWRVGAVMVKNGQVIAASPNVMRGGPSVHRRLMTMHAEEVVLQIAGSRAKGREPVCGAVG